ncbi:MAG: UMP kinase [Candidatus Methanomethylophilaceae archaeon]|jgi:uridylate kinase|nr:UMP kinase [Candidatus Methanomethylophilaceae archaeon]
MQKAVISVGGSVLIPGNDDAVYIRQLADMLREVSKEVQIAVVVGGGKMSRYYSETGRQLGGTVYQLDELGIGITRVNAKLLTVALGDIANSEIPLKAEECASMSEPGRIVVMGGTEPGHTTDAVAAMIARCMKADRVINASNVDAVYSADPRKDPDAKRFSKMTIKELKEVVGDEHDAGRSYVFDPMGVDIAMENRIDLFMVNGRDLSELRNAILGKEIKGTFVDSH